MISSLGKYQIALFFYFQSLKISVFQGDPMANKTLMHCWPVALEDALTLFFLANFQKDFKIISIC